MRSGSEAADSILPPPPSPAGTYRPAMAAHGLVWSAGMVPRVDGTLAVAGRVGESVDLSAACEAARLSVLNALAAVSEAVGGLAHIEAVVQLRVFVRCTAEFTDVSAVAEGASRALVDVIGPNRGIGVRTAVGVLSLPGGSPVEVELVATYRDEGRT